RRLRNYGADRRLSGGVALAKQEDSQCYEQQERYQAAAVAHVARFHRDHASGRGGEHILDQRDRENDRRLIAGLNTLRVVNDLDRREIWLDIFDATGGNLLATALQNNCLTVGEARAGSLVEEGGANVGVEHSRAWQRLVKNLADRTRRRLRKGFVEHRFIRHARTNGGRG